MQQYLRHTTLIYLHLTRQSDGHSWRLVKRLLEGDSTETGRRFQSDGRFSLIAQADGTSDGL